MNKTAVLILLVFAPWAHAADPPACCVSILVVTDKDAGVSCSGTIVAMKGDRRLVLTNRHVLEDAAEVYVIHAGKLVAGGKVTMSKTADDLGAFEVSIDLPIAPLAARSAFAGDEISHWGATSGSATGTVVHYFSIKEPEREYRVMSCNKLLSVPGDSGAGIFNAKKELVAVNFGAVLPLKDTVALAVPLASVKTFLKDFPQWDFKP